MISRHFQPASTVSPATAISGPGPNGPSDNSSRRKRGWLLKASMERAPGEEIIDPGKTRDKNLWKRPRFF